MTLEKYMKEIGDEDKPLKHSGLLQLSGLSSDEMVNFKATWSQLSGSRKCETLGGLVELCEDNIEVEFSSVFLACLDDDDDQVRETAARGLWECDDRVIIRPLISLLEDDPSAKVRAAAAASLGKFAAMAQNGKLLDRDAARIREALLAAASEGGEDIDVQRRAIEAVASFDSPEIEQMIREAYYSGEVKLKQSAIYAMGRNSDSRWLPIILDDMRHDDPAIRFEAASACGLFGDETAVPHLISLIKDEDSEVQLSAVHALGVVGGSLAKRALIQCQKLGDDTLEEAAEAALGSIEFDEDPLGVRFQP